MTYEYLCEQCGHEWELEQKISDKPEKVCPCCGAESAKRLISKGNGFQLKGGGWAREGYS